MAGENHRYLRRLQRKFLPCLVPGKKPVILACLFYPKRLIYKTHLRDSYADLPCPFRYRRGVILINISICLEGVGTAQFAENSVNLR